MFLVWPYRVIEDMTSWVRYEVEWETTIKHIIDNGSTIPPDRKLLLGDNLIWLQKCTDVNCTPVSSLGRLKQIGVDY